MELHFFDINFKMNILGLILGFIVVISDNTGVLAQRRSRWQDGSIRLVGGQNDNEGTVLIYHWSRWGAVCDDYWDIRDANVVCNELGFPGASDAPRESKYGKGRRRVWLSGLHCRGHERHLTMCKSRGWGIFHRRCRKYFTSAGVVCNPKTTAITRLSTTTSTTTRKRTTPTTTSSTTTTAMTTTPTTSKTTTNHAKTTTTSFIPPTTTSNRRPTTTETTTKAPLKTTTTPKRTTTTRSTAATPPRAYNRWIYNRELWRYFMYFRDGTHVTSRPDPRYYRLHGRRSTSTTTSTSTSTTTTTTTTTKPPVIDDSLYNEIGGDDEHAGVDEYIRGNNNDIQNNINYLVPQSGDNQDQSFRHSPHHHHHNNVKDGYLGDAPYAVDTDEVITIKPVKEEPEPIAPSYTEFRLSGGRVYTGFNEGRLEVRLAGRNKWGVVCGDNWDFRAAMVACRHIGVGYARTAQTTDLYGGSNKDKVLANIKCTGKEDRLEDCSLEQTQSTPGHEACSSARSVAGVICDTRLPDLTPNITRLEYSAYLQDRYLYYLQCAFEEGCLSSSAEALYGTNSWTTLTRRLLRFSTIAHNVGTADFRPDVDRSKWEWHACHQHYHSMESFSHYDIIDKHGNKVAEGHKASFCLEDSECTRGTFPKYNCQNWGQQGISVGCADSYLADIDCQWIDVTDVRSGMYTLKIELNPNMLVPEISYENNVAVCDLYFNTASVRLYNCRHEGLL